MQLIARSGVEVGRIVVDRRARAARIDALSVDRSVLAAMPSQPCCLEGQAAEEWLSAIRAKTTIQDKIEALRRLVR